MSSAAGNVFFDTCTLWNFSVVSRLDLLEKRYGYRARWTETVRYEIEKGANRGDSHLRNVLSAGWLGDPIEFDFDPSELFQVDIIRRALGGTSTNPFQHLAESEILHYIPNYEPTAIFVSDDGPARDYARRRGIITMDSSRVLAECYSYGEIGCPSAYDLLIEMKSKGRNGVNVPATHVAVCP